MPLTLDSVRIGQRVTTANGEPAALLGFDRLWQGAHFGTVGTVMAVRPELTFPIFVKFDGGWTVSYRPEDLKLDGPGAQ